jgi:hypothetical protein
MAAMLVLAACSATSPSTAPTATAAVPTPAITFVASQPASGRTASVLVSKMATSVGVIPDFCDGPGATDYPNRYTFTLTISLPGDGDATEQYAAALLGKMAHLTLNGPPDGGTLEAPIVHGPGGAGLSLIFSGGYCQPDGFSTLAALTIDGVPLTQQADGSWLGILAVS